MSNLEEIEKLYTVKRTFKIGEANLELTPLSLEDMAVMDMKENAPMCDVAKNAAKMFAISLGIPEEKAKKISFEFMEELLGKIMEINNFNDQDIKKAGIKDFIEQKKEASKAKQ